MYMFYVTVQQFLKKTSDISFCLVTSPVILPRLVSTVSATLSEPHSEEETVRGLERVVNRSCDVSQCVSSVFLGMCFVIVFLAGSVLVP